MSIVAVFVGMSTLWIFLFKREWLLSKKCFSNLLIINILLFVLSFVFKYFDIGDINLIEFLKMGLISQLVFLPLVAIFRMIYSRNPKETFWSMDLDLMKDGVFNFVYWVCAIIIPALLISYHIV